jgi:hypothetical protein
LQAINLLMTFGMSVVLSLWAPSTAFLWRYFLSHMLLSFLGAAAASFIAGLLILPSLATEAAMQAVITALRKTGQTGTLCVSILLRPQQQGGLLPGATQSLQQHLQLMQQQQQLASGMSFTSAAGTSTAGSMTAASAFSEAALAAADAADNQALDSNRPAPAAATSIISTSPATSSNAQQQQQTHASLAPTGPSSQLQQQPSLLEEVLDFTLDPPAELGRLVALSQPGQWGLHSFVVAAASSSSQTSQRQQQQQEGSKHDAAAAAAAIAAAATVPGEDEAAASEAAADDDQEEEAAHADADPAAHVSWWDQHKPSHLLHRHHDSHHQHQPSSPHKQQQQQQHMLVQQEAARHLFMRLGRGVDHIRPLLAEARLLREAVVVEQAGWLRLLTAGPAWQPWLGRTAAAAGGGGRGGGKEGRVVSAAGALPIGSWVRLVEALQAMLERCVVAQSV